MTTNPGTIRTSNRRRALSRRWNSKEWKALRAQFIKDHPFCRMHEKLGLKARTQTPHHPHMESYKAGYMTPEVLAQCTPLCNRCHFSLGKGRTLCPVCKDHYAPWDADPLMCRSCFDRAHPEIVEARVRDKEKWKEIRSELNRKAREKWRTRWSKDTIHHILEIHPAHPAVKRGINKATDAVFQSIKDKGRNPLTMREATLVDLTEEWLRRWSH
jgi:hypothetical protein